MKILYLGKVPLVVLPSIAEAPLEIQPGAVIIGKLAEKLIVAHPKLFRVVGEAGEIHKS